MFVRTTELDDAPAEHGASGSGGWSPSAGAHGSRAGPATRRLNGSARAALSPRLALSSQRRIARNEPGRNMDVVQIKVKLRGVSKPPVWRRLQVRADTSLDRLHEAIEARVGTNLKTSPDRGLGDSSKLDLDLHYIHVSPGFVPCDPTLRR